MNYFFTRMNFKHLVDNVIIRIIQMPKKFENDQNRPINESDINPNIT
jgi:hypothetical protein